MTAHDSGIVVARSSAVAVADRVVGSFGSSLRSNVTNVCRKMLVLIREERKVLEDRTSLLGDWESILSYRPNGLRKPMFTAVRSRR